MDAYDDTELPHRSRGHVAEFVKGQFLEGDIRPDVSKLNIGIKDVPLTDVVFSDTNVEWPEPKIVPREDKWVLLDTGVPHWDGHNFYQHD